MFFNKTNELKSKKISLTLNHSYESFTQVKQHTRKIIGKTKIMGKTVVPTPCLI